MPDFFISYTRPDRPWATWIAWHLEAAGWSTVLDVWDFRPGHNWALTMQQAATQAQRTLLVLSPDYLTSLYPQPEWAAAFAIDPTGAHGTLLPVRVRDCTPPGLLRALVYVDLVGLGADAARDALLAGVQQGRGKPSTAPPFPGTPPPFPGSTPAPASGPPAPLRQSWAWLQQHRTWALAGLGVALLGLAWLAWPRGDVNIITHPSGPAVIQTGGGTVHINAGEEKRQ